MAAAAAVISAAVGKQLVDNGTSSVQQQQHSSGSKITELQAPSDVIRDSRRRFDGSGNSSKREPAGATTTKAKSEIQKFYQIKEKVPTSVRHSCFAFNSVSLQIFAKLFTRYTAHLESLRMFLYKLHHVLTFSLYFRYLLGSVCCYFNFLI